jgi:heme oxygenase
MNAGVFVVVAAPVSTAVSDVLDALRAATRTRHDYVDKHMPLARTAARLSHYRDHLILLRHWLAPLQSYLTALPAPLDGYAVGMRSRLAQMDADLAATGGLPRLQDTSVAALPPQPHAFWWGVAYVIEGSQLGAAMLHKRLAPALAPFEPAYLGGEPRGPGPTWRRFLADLHAQVREPQPVADCCRGACWAFDRLIALLPAEAAA